ncbi:Por secretion system C-terminal sorting domain-containing protein [Hyunsoonleella jejuensis]|uniref:Por secretion system C-terminal sorting domain-containing protein n=1 Tax=Hyunsoonleella jejuensis TaxID=419940 RepID=A0A1H9DED9_9FLAO|nr:T9SS type A sorting domain-containing protein [Hyunsoonleella jejuensis]SEQ11749.1 Por secretion system C-terminal sorting domain-containing protein [Hyunsoonleella jejuensis]
MKESLSIQNPKSVSLFLFIIFFFSVSAFASTDCGLIAGFEFSNGNESVTLEDQQTYDINNLPENFYVNLNVDGYSQSARFTVENLETGSRHTITENLLPYTFPAGNGSWHLGLGTFKITAKLYKFDLGWGFKCDSKSVTFTINEGGQPCTADAGTLTADAGTVTLTGDSATISATPDGNVVVPEGYSKLFVLTSGDDLVIEAVGAEPSFPVTAAGKYTIHTLVYDGREDSPNFLNLGVVTLGETTGGAVLGLVIDNGLCAALDVAGAPVMVETCTADAGTLTADAGTVTLTGDSATISATPDGNVVVPEGYSKLFVLTSGDDLVIEAVGAEPSFPVTAAGKYTIHTLVYDGREDSPNFLNLGVVTLGETTGGAVLGLVIDNGLCAALDVAGAPVMVEVEEEVCEASSGKMYSPKPIQCLNGGEATISAQFNQQPYIPEGYQQLYVLTEAYSLTILQVSETPEFEVDHRGFYRIHSLVYNPGTLDLSIVQFGVTTGFDVLGLIEANNICASLDVRGAISLVIGSRWFCYFFNKYRARNGNNNGKGLNDDDLAGYINAFDNYDEFEASFVEQNDEVRFYPNPVVNNLNVEIRLFENEDMNYNIMDVRGRMIMSGSAEALKFGKFTLNTNQFAKGMYIVNFVSEFRTITKKIIIEK